MPRFAFIDVVIGRRGPVGASGRHGRRGGQAQHCVHVQPAAGTARDLSRGAYQNGASTRGGLFRAHLHAQPGVPSRPAVEGHPVQGQRQGRTGAGRPQGVREPLPRIRAGAQD